MQVGRTTSHECNRSRNCSATVDLNQTIERRAAASPWHYIFIHPYKAIDSDQRAIALNVIQFASLVEMPEVLTKEEWV